MDIKNHCSEKFKDLNINWKNHNKIRIFIIAPGFEADAVRAISPINWIYPIELIEIKRRINGEEQILFINKIEQWSENIKVPTWPFDDNDEDGTEDRNEVEYNTKGDWRWICGSKWRVGRCRVMRRLLCLKSWGQHRPKRIAGSPVGRSSNKVQTLPPRADTLLTLSINRGGRNKG